MWVYILSMCSYSLLQACLNPWASSVLVLRSTFRAAPSFCEVCTFEFSKLLSLFRSPFAHPALSLFRLFTSLCSHALLEPPCQGDRLLCQKGLALWWLHQTVQWERTQTEILPWIHTLYWWKDSNRIGDEEKHIWNTREEQRNKQKDNGWLGRSWY